jgi:PPOX class probable F420-dependent enzyme
VAAIPQQYRYLTDAPLFAHLATMRPDGTLQSNPMWFQVVGEQVHFTHTRTRQKFRNLQANPAMALSITDPQRPYRYVELRGRLVEVEDDTSGAFAVGLQHRYGNPSDEPPEDVADRVILKMAIDVVAGRVSPPAGLE